MCTANLKNLIAACILPLIIVSTASGAIIVVNPGESIQAAIDSAFYGDTIEVSAGTYIERITLKDGVAVIGAGAAVTIINGDAVGPVVTSIGCDENKVLEGFTITNGHAVNCGGMLNSTSRPTVTNCTFSGNYADDKGGGMSNWNDSSPMVTNCTFSNNSAHGYYPAGENGGGMCINYNSSLTVANCSFTQNRAGNNGGGIYNFSNSTTVINCIFGNNIAAANGGGMYNDFSNPMVINCTFSNNSASHGGGIYNYQSEPNITNCILWADEPDEIHNSSSSLTVTYSDVQGWWPDANSTNIDADPCFVDPNNDDYHLLSEAGRWNPNTQTWIQDNVTSPCIDAGDPNSSIGWEPYPNGGRINIGAHGGTEEASKSYFGRPVCKKPIAGDVNGDCCVDFKDLAIMGLHWLEDNRE